MRDAYTAKDVWGEVIGGSKIVTGVATGVGGAIRRREEGLGRGVGERGDGAFGGSVGGIVGLLSICRGGARRSVACIASRSFSVRFSAICKVIILNL